MSDNAELTLKLHNQIVEGTLALGRGGRSTSVDKAGVGTMSQLKIRIETDEYIYEEYIEA